MNSKLLTKKNVFEEKYKEVSEKQLKKDLLLTQIRILEENKAIRRNTKLMTNFLVVLPIVLGALYIVGQFLISYSKTRGYY